MISVDKVYRRVLFLVNKENRGYVTPDEFNSYSIQAQLEVFEEYFLKKFQASQAPTTMDDYSDPGTNLEEKITLFENETSISERTTLSGATSGYAYPTDFYRLSNVNINGVMADEVGNKKLTYINLSPLTAPTTTQPVFTRHENGVVVYPIDYTGAIDMIYVRKPVDPLWAFMEDPNAEPVFDEENSVNFEVHPSDEQNLVYKILALAGVTIREADVTNVASQKEAQVIQTEQ